MMQMMHGMQDPQFRELASVMSDIESGGPAAMMKCAS